MKYGSHSKKKHVGSHSATSTSNSKQVARGEEYLSLRAALGTSNSESNTNSKVSTSMKSPCSRECLVVDVDRLSKRLVFREY